MAPAVRSRRALGEGLCAFAGMNVIHGGPCVLVILGYRD